jgi:hypothetical protein
MIVLFPAVGWSSSSATRSYLSPGPSRPGMALVAYIVGARDSRGPTSANSATFT